MGYTIKIFGLTLDFNGTSSIAWTDPKLPGFDLHLSLDSPAAPKKLSLKAKGKLPLAEIDFDLIIDVTTSSSTIVLGKVSKKAKTDFALVPASSTTLLPKSKAVDFSTAPTQNLPLDIGLAFPVNDDTAGVPLGVRFRFNALRTAFPLLHGRFVLSKPTDPRWQYLLVGFDLQEMCVVYAFRNPPQAVHSDSGGLASDSQICNAVYFRRSAADPLGLDAAFESANGRLLIHKEVLDPDDGEVALRHAELVNGFLIASFSDPSGAGGEPTKQLTTWGSRRDGSWPALFCYQFASEHGLPVAIVPDDGRYCLDTRFGGPTNDATVIGELTAGLPQPVKLLHLDHDKIWARSKSFERDAWVIDGTVPLGKSGPRQLFGLATGTRLVRNNDDTTVEAELSVNSFHAQIGGMQRPVFHVPTIRPKKVSDWSLKVQRADQDVYASSAPAPQLEPLAEFYAAATGASPFHIPLIDTKWAIANIFPRDENNYPAERRALAADLHVYMVALDTDFKKAFAALDLAPQYRQLAGASARRGPAALNLDRIFGAFPLRADSWEATRQARLDMVPQNPTALPASTKPGWELATADYKFGGREYADFAIAAAAGDPNDLLKDEMAKAQSQIGVPFSNFIKAWLGDALANSVRALRQELSLDVFNRIALENSDEDALDDLQQQISDDALALLQSGGALADAIGDVSFRNELIDELMNRPADAFCAMLVDYLDDGEDGYDDYRPLFRALIAPPSADLFRRLLALALGTDEVSVGIKNRLGAAWTAFANAIAFAADLPKPISALLIALREGVPGLRDDLNRLWAGTEAEVNQLFNDITGAFPGGVLLTEILATFGALRTKYGPVLTNDVLTRLAGSDDEQVLLDLLRDKFGIAALRRLTDIPTAPPDYVVISDRFKTQTPRNALPPAMWSLWSQTFPLCDLGGGRQWTFFIGGNAIIIAKLTRVRTLATIIREVHSNYRTDERADPLGLGAFDPDEWLSKLPADIAEDSNWQGAFVLHPTADIAADTVLSAIAGFDHIDADWVAIGGKSPEGKNAALLSTAARILRIQEQTPNLDDNVHEDAGHDGGFTLIKFDVTIRDTQIAQGEIVTRLDLGNLFGRRGPTKDQKYFEPIFVRAALPPADTRTSNPRSFEFSAWFEQPRILTINLLFLKELSFKSLHAVNGSDGVSLQVDASLKLQNSSVGDFEDLDWLQLNGLRILLPPRSGAQAIRFGLPRGISFDFPSVKIALSRARAFNLFGLEFLPNALGLLRNVKTSKAAFHQLTREFQLIDLPGLPAAKFPAWDGVDMMFPHLYAQLDLGKLAVLGGGTKLALDVLIGLPIIGGDLKTPVIALRGLDARDIDLDLFRLLRLRIERLIFSADGKVGLKSSPQIDAGVIVAENARLELMGWNPLGSSSRLDFLYVNPRDVQRRDKGWLVAYDRQGVSSGGFLKIHWIVLARAMAFSKEFYDLLIIEPNGSAETAIRGLIDISDRRDDASPDKPRKVGVKIAADIIEDREWLFASAFSLDKILDRCTFVMQDGRYYGIRLSADWVKSIFGQDPIELAYIPGATRRQDRFRTSFALKELNLFAGLRSGVFDLEWGVDWSYHIGAGFPIKVGDGYDWFRAFSLAIPPYEGKFGFYVEQNNSAGPTGDMVRYGAGFALYVGYYWGSGNGVAWIRAGIGVFAILEGAITFDRKVSIDLNNLGKLRDLVYQVEIHGVIGIFAYGEGGIEIWIISARFRVSCQASVGCAIVFTRGSPVALTYEAAMSAAYYAEVRIGSGFFSWTFSVSGAIGISVSGHTTLG